MTALLKILTVTILVTGIASHSMAGEQSQATASGEEAVKEEPVAPEADKDVRKEVREAIDAIKSYSIEKRDLALKKSKEILDDFDARTANLERRIAEKESKWSEKFAKKKAEELEELKKARAEAAKNFESFRNSSKEAWETTKDAFIKSYRQLEHKFNQLKSGTSEPNEEKRGNSDQAGKP